MRKQTWEESPSCRECDKLEKEIAELRKQLDQANFELVEMQVELANLQDQYRRKVSCDK
jgi:predicted  nucleic acid-binding Zn-ribbon protein